MKKKLIRFFVIIAFFIGFLIIFQSWRRMKILNLQFITNSQSNKTNTVKITKIVNEFEVSPFRTKYFNIGIGLGITTREVPNGDKDILNKTPFFRHFMPSFVKTFSPGMTYNFYLGYDFNDWFFEKEANRISFQKKFHSFCYNRKISASITFHECKYDKRPTWSQNDAMMIAYLDGNDYLYRINDDTILETSGWTEGFIMSLLSFEPRNIGAVGPKHSGGNEFIITYDFVHRTHVDIFGRYYPQLFTDWWGDNWMSFIYAPHRVSKLNFVLVKHVQTKTRYSVTRQTQYLWQGQVIKDRKFLTKCLHIHEKNRNKSPSRSKLIIITVQINSEDQLYGALRNAQLRYLFFPEWKLRIIVSKPLDKLWSKAMKRLDVDVEIADNPSIKFEYLPLLAVNEKQLDALLIRNATSRLSDIDYNLVENFLHSNYSVHIIKDKKNTDSKLRIGIMGFRPKNLPFLSFAKIEDPWNWLQTTFYKIINSLCVLNVACKYDSMEEFEEYFGKKYNKRMEVVS
ncbi:DgyrCDS10544 [Dimorphilus gyrociliatus]|uniref:DgyrCDS10544 n=1 Tax=Dimorphilus gyrociliatus TaxID=2664684 RepID=A0A7I8W5M4_9ANNE|nr:DgyrCDS10544 [Dimorphilus gyrociliatus]